MEHPIWSKTKKRENFTNRHAGNHFQFRITPIVAQEDISVLESLPAMRRKTFPFQNYSLRRAGRHFRFRMSSCGMIVQKRSRYLDKTLCIWVIQHSKRNNLQLFHKKNSHLSARALKNIAYFDYHRFLDNKKTLVTGFI